MFQLTHLEPVDYLMIGHLTVDLTPEGPRLGGTAFYSSLMARALGLRVGIVTSWGAELPLGLLKGIPVANYPADKSTTFENLHTEIGRKQHIHSIAPSLDFYHVPEPWRSAPIVHLGPVAQEIEPGLMRQFPGAQLSLTPQGWLRGWDRDGKVFHTEWPEAGFVLSRATATVISREDVDGSEERIEEMAASCRILAVTEAGEGVRLFWNGDVRRFRPPAVQEVDPVGAGDIFAAAFFTRLQATRDPWEACRFATQLAAISVTRPGTSGLPTPEEINQAALEML